MSESIKVYFILLKILSELIFITFALSYMSQAKYKKDIATARQLWKDLIGCGHKEEARVWLDYSTFEK